MQLPSKLLTNSSHANSSQPRPYLAPTLLLPLPLPLTRWFAAGGAEAAEGASGASAEDERGDNQRGDAAPVPTPQLLAPLVITPERRAAEGGAAEVQAPIEAPIEAPTEAPTEAPAEAPAEAPVDAPVDAPVEAPQSDQGSPHPRRRGYVRAASGYLYNSLPSLSGSASLNSTPLKQG